MIVTRHQMAEIAKLRDDVAAIREELATPPGDSAPFVGQIVRFIDDARRLWPAVVMFVSDESDPGSNVDLFVMKPSAGDCYGTPRHDPTASATAGR